MGAIIMDGAVIGSNSVIAAGSLITEKTIVKEGSVYAGVPAKFLRKTDAGLIEGQIRRIAESYEKYASWYK